MIFLSTLSLRRATRCLLACFVGCFYFYPRSPCGERHVLILSYEKATKNFYPRSPCGERLWAACGPAGGRTFLSTLSLRRATMIHPRSCNAKPNFYPRSPCGERLDPDSDSLTDDVYFYPRSPCGERLNDAINGCNPDFISIHALLAESDCECWTALNHLLRFLSTLSLRRATNIRQIQKIENDISIHALLAESDQMLFR